MDWHPSRQPATADFERMALEATLRLYLEGDAVFEKIPTLRMISEDPAAVVAAVRSLVVKSRGHFRAGFDETFPPERILEVDVPGLTTVVLGVVAVAVAPLLTWRRLRRMDIPSTLRVME